MSEAEFFHVSSSSNRRSIGAHGLDVSRMAAARGIAGSREPEVDGCFIACNAYERDWFVRMNNTGGPVDVWRVEGIDADSLVVSPHGFTYIPGTIAVDRIALVAQDIPPLDRL